LSTDPKMHGSVLGLTSYSSGRRLWIPVAKISAVTDRPGELCVTQRYDEVTMLMLGDGVWLNVLEPVAVVVNMIEVASRRSRGEDS
jgi:hypothetical protein